MDETVASDIKADEGECNGERGMSHGKLLDRERQRKEELVQRHNGKNICGLRGKEEPFTPATYCKIQLVR
jgi:hypothetical protein